MNFGKTSNYKAAAIIVTFYPDLIKLDKLINTISPQVNHCLIIDNTPEESLAKIIHTRYKSLKYKYHWMTDNIGLAKAQNYGIKLAKELHNSHIILFDQDSLPAVSMIEEQFKTLSKLICQGKKVCAIGPVILHENTKITMPLIQISNKQVNRIHLNNENIENFDYIPVTILMSSGSLIPISAIDDIGDMDESLFIDQIDTDWSLRARNEGYCCFISIKAKMSHTLGEETMTLPIGNQRIFRIHKPFRYYYMVRNSIYLYKKHYNFKRWILFDMSRYIKVLTMTFLSPTRFQCFKMIAMGLIDGLLGKTGKALNVTR